MMETKFVENCWWQDSTISTQSKSTTKKNRHQHKNFVTKKFDDSALTNRNAIMNRSKLKIPFRSSCSCFLPGLSYRKEYCHSRAFLFGAISNCLKHLQLSLFYFIFIIPTVWVILYDSYAMIFKCSTNE